VSKDMNQEKRNTSTSELLAEILGPIESFFMSLPPLPYYSRSNYFKKSFSDAEWEEFVSTKRKKRAIKLLKEKNYLESKKIGNEMILRISTDGVVKAIQNEIRSESRHLPSYQHCLVIFDFPNGATKARNHWRRILLSVGFSKWQLSVYATRKHVMYETLTLVHLLGLAKWVRVCRVNQIH
jgi:hypothetical protein